MRKIFKVTVKFENGEELGTDSVASESEIAAVENVMTRFLEQIPEIDCVGCNIFKVSGQRGNRGTFLCIVSKVSDLQFA